MKSDAKTFLTYLGKEVVQPTVYIFAFIIGSTICLLTSAFSIIPFMVPLLVQIMVRSTVKFRQRHRDALVELPAQKEDPVFIMDMTGRIILSVGKTRTLFEKYDVTNIKSFISDEAFHRIIASTAAQGAGTPPGVEVFSNMTLKWYEVRAAATAITYGDGSPKVLVWFQDISQRQVYFLRLKDLLRYSDTLIDTLEMDKGGMETASRHLAVFLLKEYGCAFITRADSDNNLNGYAYRATDEGIRRSDPIQIPSQSLAPINISRQTARIISDHAANWETETAFLEAYPFDPRVIEFMGTRVRNFITHHEDDVSIIAFNFRSGITAHEREFFKVVVNIFKTMTTIVDLKTGDSP